MGVVLVGEVIWRLPCFSPSDRGFEVITLAPTEDQALRLALRLILFPILKFFRRYRKARMSLDSGVDLQFLLLPLHLDFAYCCKSPTKSCVGSFEFFLYNSYTVARSMMELKSINWYQIHMLGYRWFYNIKMWVFDDFNPNACSLF